MVSISQIFFALGALIIPVVFALFTDYSEIWRPVFGALAVVSILTIVAGFRVRQERFGVIHGENGSSNIATLVYTSISLAFYVGAEVTLFGWAPSVFWIGMLLGRIVVARLTARYRPIVLLRVSALRGIGSALLMSLAVSEASAHRCFPIWRVSRLKYCREPSFPSWPLHCYSWSFPHRAGFHGTGTRLPVRASTAERRKKSAGQSPL